MERLPQKTSSCYEGCFCSLEGKRELRMSLSRRLLFVLQENGVKVKVIELHWLRHNKETRKCSNFCIVAFCIIALSNMKANHHL